jgi:heat shock protein HslJ
MSSAASGASRGGTRTRPSKMLGAVILLVSLVALVACSSRGSPLDGTQWRLSEWTLSSLNPADFTITATFADGQISGNSGVNTYSGPYTLGPDAAFSAGPFVATQMAGSEPATRAETAYLTLLGQATSYEMVDGKLTLFDKGGNESLGFAATSV